MSPLGFGLRNGQLPSRQLEVPFQNIFVAVECFRPAPPGLPHFSSKFRIRKQGQNRPGERLGIGRWNEQA